MVRNLLARKVRIAVGKKQLEHPYDLRRKAVGRIWRKLRFQFLYFGIKLCSFKARAFTNCRYGVRMVGVHFCNLRIRFHQACLYYKLVRLYFLDKGLCLSVLRSLNKFDD